MGLLLTTDRPGDGHGGHANREYLVTVGASIAAVLDLVGRTGAASVSEASGHEGRAVFEVSWR